MKLSSIGSRRNNATPRPLLVAVPFFDCQNTATGWMPAFQAPAGNKTVGNLPKSRFKAGDIALMLKLVAAAVALTFSAFVSAIGMGGINVVSSLGQPLKADIELVALNKAEKSSLVARLASPDAYRGAGLEYPYGNKFKFQIEVRANGESYINVSSAQPINDPFVSLLVELNWSSGKILREYTFLIDPPNYVAEPPAEMQVVAPAVVAAPSAVISKPAYEKTETAPLPGGSAEVKDAAHAKPAKSAPKEAAKTITVMHGDFLAKIAMKHKPDEVSLERMLIALFRANSEQFDGHNMNRISIGKILRLPDQDELKAVTQSDAIREIAVQTADWKSYRQKLAGSATASSQPSDTKQVAAGKIVSQVTDKAPAARENAREVLKLSKGEAPEDKIAAATAVKSPTAADKKITDQEDAVARSRKLKEEQARAALLESNLKDMQRLAQLKLEAAALAQSQNAASAAVAAIPAASQVIATSAAVAASQVLAASAAASAAKPKPAPIHVEEPSLVDQILGEPLLLGGSIAILLVMGGIGYLWKSGKLTTPGFTGSASLLDLLSSRKRADAKGDKNAADKESALTEMIAGRITEPVVPSPDTGDFTGKAAADSVAKYHVDEIDPISEADLFLNFGRDVQAEEILKEALLNTPGNHLIHLKLLSIYANRKDMKSFADIARKLKDSGDEDSWEQAAIMGHRLEPNNPMYGQAGIDDKLGMQASAIEAGTDSGLEEVKTEQELSAPNVDFDLGASTEGKEAAGTLDFEVTSVKSQAAPMDLDFNLMSDSSTPDTTAKVDLDVAASMEPVPAGAETAPLNMDDMAFDISITQSEQPKEAETSEQKKPAQDKALEFTLDFKIEDVPAKPAPAAQPAQNSFADISLSFDDAVAPEKPVTDTKSAHWHEVATKFDLVMAYQEMGDAAAAHEILEEILKEGDEEQRASAQALLDQIG